MFYDLTFLRTKNEDDDYFHYLELLHYAEGSAILPFLLLLYSRFLGDGAKPLEPRIYSEINNQKIKMISSDNKIYFSTYANISIDRLQKAWKLSFNKCPGKTSRF